MEPYRLEIPPDPEFFITARLFAAAVARRGGSEALVDDVKLAVTEAASLLLDSSETTAPIAIEASLADDALRFVLARDGTLAGDSQPESSEALLGMDLVRAIFPTLRVDHDAGTETVVISFDTTKASTGG